MTAQEELQRRVAERTNVPVRTNEQLRAEVGLKRRADLAQVLLDNLPAVAVLIHRRKEGTAFPVGIRTRLIDLRENPACFRWPAASSSR